MLLRMFGLLAESAILYRLGRVVVINTALCLESYSYLFASYTPLFDENRCMRLILYDGKRDPLDDSAAVEFICELICMDFYFFLLYK